MSNLNEAIDVYRKSRLVSLMTHQEAIERASRFPPDYLINRDILNILDQMGEEELMDMSSCSQERLTKDYYRIDYYDNANHDNNVHLIDDQVDRLLDLVHKTLPVHQDLRSYLKRVGVAIWGLQGRHTMVLSFHTPDRIYTPPPVAK